MASTLEQDAFLEVLTTIKPSQITGSFPWTAHQLVAHMVAGCAEVIANLTAYVAHGPDAVPPTRFGDERENPYRQQPFDGLRSALPDLLAEQQVLITNILSNDTNAVTPWMGRQMPVAAFITHFRSEFAIHRWDLVGHDELGDTLLADPDLTRHAVIALGGPLLQKWRADTRNVEHAEHRLRTPGADDIAIVTGALCFTATDHVVPTVEGTPAARLLFLWGRTPEPKQLFAPAGRAQLREIRAMLSGY